MNTIHYNGAQEEFQSSEDDYDSVPEPLTAMIPGHDENDCTISVQEQPPEAAQEKRDKKAYSLADLRLKHFLFEDPSARRSEMNSFIYEELEPRFRKVRGLSQLSDGDKELGDYVDEVTTKIMKEEVEKGKYYSKAEVKRKVHQWFNLRVRSWLRKKKQQDRYVYALSQIYLVERDNEGIIIDVAFGSLNEPDLSANNINPHYHIPIDVLVSKQEISLAPLIEQTICIMARRRTKNSRKHIAVLAPLFNDPDMSNDAELEGLSNIKLNNLYFHARRYFISIIEGLCPDIRRILRLHTKNREIAKRKVKKINENYRNPLFNEDHQHGDIIVYRKTDGPSENASSIVRGSSHYIPIKSINFNDLVSARELYGKKDGTRLILGTGKMAIEEPNIIPVPSLCPRHLLDQPDQPEELDDYPEYDDAA